VKGDWREGYSVQFMRLLRLAGTAPLLAAAALLGCGGGSSSNGVASETPTQILQAAKAAADGAASAHISGSIVSEGTPISLDLELLAGKGGHGQLAESGLSFQLIQVGKYVYVYGSAAFYRHVGGAAAAQLLQGKWLKAPVSDSNFASIASLTNLSKLVDTTLASHGTLARGASATVDGQKVVAVHDVSQGGTLYVASTGKPYPVEVVKNGGNGGRIVFDRWNKAVTLVAPATAINISQLQAGR
jgi:hypothetical protein